MDVEEMIRRSMPEVDESMTPRAKSDLAAILASHPKKPAWKTQLKRWWKATLTALTAAVITITMLLMPRAAFAATFPVLVVKPVTSSLSDVLANLMRLAGDQPARIGNEVVEHIWGLVTVVEGEGEIVDSYVHPEKRVLRLGSAGVEDIRNYAEQSYDSAGKPVNDPASPPPGAFLGEVVIPPEEQFLVFTGDFPTDLNQVGEYFANAMPPAEPSLAIDAIQWIRTLLEERILSPTQESALVGWLASVPDLRLLGESTDRLGRPVAVFEAPTKDEYMQWLLIDINTGRIAGVETLYVGYTRKDIPSPAVVEYICWE